MTKDIQPILEGWDYEPGDVSVRIVRGVDSHDKVQMRIDLGLLQMEMDGRPDGARPHASESLLDYFESNVAQLRTAGAAEEFRLTEEDCEELLRESVQYYYRYLSFFHLSRYDLAERDTRRNLRLFEFVRRHAPSEEEKWRFDQYRPYVTMMHTRARANPLCDAKRYRDAIAIVEQGIDGIRGFLREYELEDREDECMELAFLKRWREEINRTRPLEPAEKLHRQLEQAIRGENYERAAQLRDQLRKLNPS